MTAKEKLWNEILIGFADERLIELSVFEKRMEQYGKEVARNMKCKAVSIVMRQTANPAEVKNIQDIQFEDVKPK